MSEKIINPIFDIIYNWCGDFLKDDDIHKLCLELAQLFEAELERNITEDMDDLEDQLAATSDALGLIKEWAKDLHLSHGRRPLSRQEIQKSLERIFEQSDLRWE